MRRLGSLPSKRDLMLTSILLSIKPLLENITFQNCFITQMGFMKSAQLTLNSERLFLILVHLTRATK